VASGVLRRRRLVRVGHRVQAGDRRLPGQCPVRRRFHRKRRNRCRAALRRGQRPQLDQLAPADAGFRRHNLPDGLHLHSAAQGSLRHRQPGPLPARNDLPVHRTLRLADSVHLADSDRMDRSARHRRPVHRRLSPAEAQPPQHRKNEADRRARSRARHPIQPAAVFRARDRPPSTVLRQRPARGRSTDSSRDAENGAQQQHRLFRRLQDGLLLPVPVGRPSGGDDLREHTPAARSAHPPAPIDRPRLSSPSRRQRDGDARRCGDGVRRVRTARRGVAYDGHDVRPLSAGRRRVGRLAHVERHR